VILYSRLNSRLTLAKPNIALPQYPCRKANTAKSTAKAGLFSQTEQGKALRMLFHFSLLLITSKAAKAFSAKR
jgi:hypothetical protein